MKNDRTTRWMTGSSRSLNRFYLSLCLALACFVTLTTQSAEPKVLKDIPYKTGDNLSAYEQERCKLDLYLPAQKDFATLVWFHGGGLTAGKKDEEFTIKIANSLAKSGIAVVSVNYRLSPKAKYPAYIEDAAASFAWTIRHIKEHGGDSKRVFIGGHSAGGYLTAIVGLDERYLKSNGLKLDDIAGLIPVSGQMMTHFTIRQERGLEKYNVIADDAAPIFYCRKESVPMLVIYTDNDMATRQEEDAYFVSTMAAAGNKRVKGALIPGRTHGSIAGNMAHDEDEAKTALLDFMKKISREREKSAAASK